MPSSDPRAAERLPSGDELRQLWESGRRSECLRIVLANWDTVTARLDNIHWLEEALRRSGLNAEAFALRVAMMRRRTSPDLHGWTSLIRSIWQTGDPWWAAELLREMPSTSRELQALGIELDLALGDAAPSIARWEREYDDDAAREAAIAWWVRCGRVEEAERVAQSTPACALWRARFALWHNDTATARQLLRELPSSPAADCLRASAEVLDGRPAEAERMLRPLLDSEVRGDAWGWLAGALRMQGRFGEAAQAAETAMSIGQDFNLAMWIERNLSVDLEHAAGAPPGYGESRMRRIGDLENAAIFLQLGLRPEQPSSALAGLLQRFAGNRTPNVTLADGGRLASHPLPPDGGQLGVTIQLVLRTRGLEAVRALYRELAPRAAGHPRFALYEGEIELWMGEYETAARIFRGILAKQRDVKWAWIGLGASAMFQGDLAEAQRIWAEGLTINNFAGPTLYVYRGECYRRQGEIGRAREDLQYAVQQKPQRLSGWMNLALADEQGTDLARVHRECVEVAPILMGELPGGPAEQLEHALEAMRGNRGSTRVTYHLWGRVWHFMSRPLDARASGQAAAG